MQRVKRGQYGKEADTVLTAVIASRGAGESIRLKQSSVWAVKTGWDLRSEERLPFRAWRGTSLRLRIRGVRGRTGGGEKRGEGGEGRRGEKRRDTPTHERDGSGRSLQNNLPSNFL